ncbi:hypothetical protein B0H14DRAFT_2905085 [Mycena olivaceomarginata]|nr:hypothetical protein B0H14DRAFT_2905085 [Mycena olivaceomarginata]
MLLNVFELFWPAHLVLVHCGFAMAVGVGRDTRKTWETARNVKTPVDHRHAESEGGDVLAVYPDSSALFDF